MDNIRTVPGRTRPVDAQPGTPRRSSARRWWILVGVLIALLVIPSLLTDMITDWMWFTSQNLADVYTTRLWLALGVFFGGTILAALFFWANWTFAARASRTTTVFPGQRTPISGRVVQTITIVSAVVLGLFMGSIAASEWPTILLWIHGASFGQTDPLFHNDIGFYVFTLPFYSLARGWAMGLLFVAAVGVVIVYAINSGVSGWLQAASTNNGSGGSGGSSARRGSIPRFNFNLDKHVGTHLSVLGAIFLLLIAVGYWLSTFNLLYSTNSKAYGAGYTDVNARLPALNILMVVAAAAAVLLIINLWVRTWKLLIGAVGVWLVALVIVGGVYPWFVQQFIVSPSELTKETPYILNSIAATRQAFGLDKFSEREVPAVNAITSQQISENTSVVNDIRLWDYRPLLATFSQLQEFRSYYQFQNVDIDRYPMQGRTRQVMLSARELSSEQLSDQVRTWQNQHLVYTHGYGAVVASVNDIVGEGLPNLLVENVPPQTDIDSLKMTNPAIYYGELTSDYVFVNTGTDEFDYPKGDTNATTHYTGKGGVALSGIIPKLLFSLRFGDGNVLLSSYITDGTRVLFHRNIQDAVQMLAPFLQYDDDPYLVIADGKLYWIQDAYATSDRYPYSAPYEGTFNYIRNSVKVVIDAYDGTATYYVIDPTDPIIQAYRGIFPALFKDISQMPPTLRAHIRYPERLLNVQAEMYATYHMTDPQVFYTKEDVWTVPFGTQEQTSAPLEAYYTMMRLPGETSDNFSLILPFTPRTKDNMIAWIAARSDGDQYGKVDVIRYPKQQLVYGPRQIEARISQDSTISQQLTLWNASGSQVIRGNLLTIPVSNSVLYVEPLFLQATSSSQFPELKRVIVATGDRVGMGTDLSSALTAAMSGVAVVPPDTGGTTPPGTPGPQSTPGTQTAAQLTQSALQHYDKAQQALKDADWTTYGREISAMKSDLDQLALLTGAAAPTPGAGTATPAATPAP